MMGFGSGTKIDNSNYTTSNGRIWLDDVRCKGTETDIAECSHSGWGIHNCQHREDVAVSCALTKVAVRLNGGHDPREGRLELLYNGTWGFVCGGGGFNDAAARVVCNMLGFGYTGRPSRKYYDRGSGPTWLRSVQCSGTETSISECGHNGWSDGYCYYQQAVSCLPNNAVALFGGGSPREGRLEVYRNGTWGTVCDDGFTDAAARVVCCSLGLGSTGQEVNINNYGIGDGKILLDDVHCDGTERHIGECSHRGWGVHNCVHKEDVAVSCTGESSETCTKLPPASTSASTERDNDHSDPHMTQIIIAVVVVGGLLLITCVIVIGLVVHFRRNPRHERSDAAMIPMPVTASTNSYSNDAFDGTEKSENPTTNARRYNNAYSSCQQPSAPVAGAVGGVGTDEDYEEPAAMYETLTKNRGRSPQVQPSYDNLKRKQPKF